MLSIKAVDIFVLHAPIDTPVRTSFGTMHDRPAVLVRVTDINGITGWGEIWCNFPSCGAEHRAQLGHTIIAPLLLGNTFATPQDAWHYLTEKTSILMLQADEPGPLAQAICGFDIALWDIVARQRKKPLYSILGDAAMTRLPAYASGINPENVKETILRARAEGYKVFKLKVGFGKETDRNNLSLVMDMLLPGESLAVDANQAWDLPSALDAISTFNDLPLLWLEEPLPCNVSLADWTALAEEASMPLAAGENIRSHDAFTDAIKSKAIHTIQPDICKWGGLSQCLYVAQKALKHQKRYCPHYLGSGIGLMASAHLLAAVGGDGMLEVDCNPNVLRSELITPYPKLENGFFILTAADGLGVSIDMSVVEKYVTMTLSSQKE